MEVRVSGAVMAAIFHEISTGQGDLEGFLLGDSTGRTVNTISDSQSQHSRYERIATIQGILPCSEGFSFYNGVGQIDEKKLDQILQSNTENVIGWYRYRRNTRQHVTMRERYIHHNLVHTLGFAPAKEFLFGLFTAALSSGLSTHLHSYQLLSASHIKSNFESHKLRVVNLGDTSHSEYRLQPHTIRTSSNRFDDVINVYRCDFLDSNNCLQQALTTHSMCISVMSKMKGLMHEVLDSEHTVAAMADEVTKLRSQLLDKRQQLQKVEAATRDTSPLQPVASASSSSEEKLEQSKKADNLIDLNSDEESERIVEGAEEISRTKISTSPFHLTHAKHLLNKELLEKEKSPVSGNLRIVCTVSESSTPKQEEKPYSSNEDEILQPQVINEPEEMDDDETQDFGLPDLQDTVCSESIKAAYVKPVNTRWYWMFVGCVTSYKMYDSREHQ